MRKMILYLAALVLAISLCGCNYATHEKPSSPGGKYLTDHANLFEGEDLSELHKSMEKLSEYGNVGIYTIADSHYGMNTATYASELYDKNFGTQSGFLFVIDMATREIYIETDGYIGDYVTPAKALTITDNVYRYASRGDYADCANNAILQALRLLEGKSISQKMRIVSCIFLAVISALLLNFAFLRFLNRKPAVTTGELSLVVDGHARFTNDQITVDHKTYVEAAQVDKVNTALLILRILLILLGGGGSGGGGGRSSGGGGRSGGGGGHSSHGGGHRF
ncbi:MAG: TPM domain-containing protein [Lachnospiraceae bacterium]|nr:TPM domain-containing protein [Lachnospiraceae bacterium]